MGGDYRAAEWNFKKAIMADYQTAEAHAGLGQIYERARQWGKAAAEYVIAIQIDPRDAAYRDNLGVFYATMGKMDAIELGKGTAAEIPEASFGG